MTSDSGSKTPAGTLAGECWLAVQADSAATHTTAAAATTLTVHMLIRRATARPGCASACPVPKPAGRIREHPAYAQLQDRVHEISELKTQF